MVSRRLQDSAYAGKFYSAAGEIGVYSGIGTATGAIAVYGTAPGTDAIGLWGNADGAGGYGVYAITAGGVDSSGNAPIAVYGEAYNSAGTGIEGFARAAGTGVAGLSNSGPGIIGTSSSGEGIYGISTSGNAGYFQNSAAETAALYSFNSASADGSPYLPIATYGEAYGTNGIGVQGYGEFGVGVRGFSSEVSNLAEKFQGDGIHAGVWGDIGTGTGYPYLAGVLGSADDNTAGYFQNSSDTYTTVGAYNAGSGGKGLFTTFQASTPTGTCGIGSGDMTCSGQLKTLATMGDGVRKVETYAMQSPENWMEDFGSGLIKNGIAIVTIDSAFVETANTAAAYHVFLTPNGDSKGLYVVARTSTTFEVHEAGSGTSTLSFDYRIVAKRRGYEAQRLVDVTERYEAETTAIRTRMLSTKSAPKSIFKLPVRPAPRSIGTRRVVERSGRSKSSFLHLGRSAFSSSGILNSTAVSKRIESRLAASVAYPPGWATFLVTRAENPPARPEQIYLSLVRLDFAARCLRNARGGRVLWDAMYSSGREPAMSMSTSLLPLCCQSAPGPIWEAPISARSRSYASRSLRRSPLFLARFTNSPIAP